MASDGLGWPQGWPQMAPDGPRWLQGWTQMAYGMVSGMDSDGSGMDSDGPRWLQMAQNGFGAAANDTAGRAAKRFGVHIFPKMAHGTPPPARWPQMVSDSPRRSLRQLQIASNSFPDSLRQPPRQPQIASQTASDGLRQSQMASDSVHGPPPPARWLQIAADSHRRSLPDSLPDSLRQPPRQPQIASQTVSERFRQPQTQICGRGVHQCGDHW
jgi:hypothetical protein